MAYEAADNAVLLFGGQSVGPSGYDSVSFDDTWTLDASGWHLEHSPQTPGGLAGPIVADPASGDLIMVGGAGTATWSWDGTAWMHLSDLPGASTTPLGLVALKAPSQLVLVTEDRQATATETWTRTGSGWSRRRPAIELPVAAVGPILAADPALDRIVAVLQAVSGGPTQTWAWDGATWALMASTPVLQLDPTSTTLAPDPQSGGLLLYTHPAGSPVGCTWLLSGDVWREVDASSPPVDTAYFGASLLADTRLERVILIGGAARPNPLNVLWVFSGSTWTAEPASMLGP